LCESYFKKNSGEPAEAESGGVCDPREDYRSSDSLPLFLSEKSGGGGAKDVAVGYR
jgi:hypothetical protein